MATSTNSSVYINVTGAITVDSPLAISANEISLPLTAAHVFVGVAGVATDVAMSGDIHIDNTGATTIQPLSVGTSKLAAQTLNNQTDDYILVLGDAQKLVTMNKGSGNSLTVPLAASVAFPIGTVIDIIQLGAGLTTIVATGGVTINKAVGLKLSARYGRAKLQLIAADSWIASGDLSA